MNPEEIIHRVKKVEDRLDKVSSRVDKLEEKWIWITKTLGKLLDRMGEVSENVTVTLQRYDKSDELLVGINRKVDSIGERLTALPCTKEEEHE